MMATHNINTNSIRVVHQNSHNIISLHKMGTPFHSKVDEEKRREEKEK
jgi:hypothetical protein